MLGWNRHRLAAVGISLALLGASLSTTATSAAAEEFDPCDVRGVSRIVAVGDVHGAHDNLITVLRSAGLIDRKKRWSGGTTHLVQTGDVLDRGDEEREVMDLLMKLEKQARKAGGRVHALMGNHEIQNFLGLFSAVTPKGFEAFARDALASYAIGTTTSPARTPKAARRKPPRASTRTPSGPSSTRTFLLDTSSVSKPSARKAATAVGCAAIPR